jgi:hypothetical protein
MSYPPHFFFALSVSVYISLLLDLLLPLLLCHFLLFLNNYISDSISFSILLLLSFSLSLSLSLSHSLTLSLPLALNFYLHFLFLYCSPFYCNIGHSNTALHSITIYFMKRASLNHFLTILNCVSGIHRARDRIVEKEKE